MSFRYFAISFRDFVVSWFTNSHEPPKEDFCICILIFRTNSALKFAEKFLCFGSNSYDIIFFHSFLTFIKLNAS